MLAFAAIGYHAYYMFSNFQPFPKVDDLAEPFPKVECAKQTSLTHFLLTVASTLSNAPSTHPWYVLTASPTTNIPSVGCCAFCSTFLKSRFAPLF